VRFSFSDHLALVDRFLQHRVAVVERIEQTLLNVRDKDTARRRDRPFFERAFGACFFGLPGIPVELSRLQGQLAAVHLAEGFEPVASETRYVNELDPLELILRAYEHWDGDRWPGRSGRLGYARTLYAVFMLRLLERMSLRIWDEGADRASDLLDHLQERLDCLNAPDSPAIFARDAGWLIQTAQGPLTKHLKPYLDVAERTSSALTGSRRLAVHKAGARLAGGHLRSQRRYRMWQTGRPPDAPENLAFTRNSNALDGALLVRDLVPLLEAYRLARDARDEDERLDLGDAILQAVSADPELYVTRLDLLAPYVMIEDLFVERWDGGVRRTAMGETALAYLNRYGELIGELAEPLGEDAEAFDPANGSYSPQGIAYGFIADVMSNIAQDSLVGNPASDLSLEDMFVSRGRLDEKLARARHWGALPLRPGERAHFDHSTEAAAQSHAKVTAALAARARHPARANASERRDAKVFVTPAPSDVVAADDYCVTSDPVLARPDGPALYPREQLVIDRNEGRFLASVPSGNEWFAVSKIILTTFTSQGTDAALTKVPEAAVDVLRLTCPGIIAPGWHADAGPPVPGVER
jgi:hypothetical protein